MKQTFRRQLNDPDNDGDSDVGNNKNKHTCRYSVEPRADGDRNGNILVKQRMLVTDSVSYRPNTMNSK